MSGFDALPTPLHVAQQSIAFIHQLMLYETGNQPAYILDPGAGYGVWGRAVSEVFINAHVIGVEIQDRKLYPSPKAFGYDQWIRADYLHPSMRNGVLPSCALIVGNPPYNKAQEFIEASMTHLAEGGYLAQFLRLGFTASRKRIPFFEKYPPYHIRVFSRRPSFTGDKKTDRGQEYALFVWREGKWWERDTLRTSPYTAFSWEFGGDGD